MPRSDDHRSERSLRPAPCPLPRNYLFRQTSDFEPRVAVSHANSPDPVCGQAACGGDATVIGRLRGRVLELAGTAAVIDVQGVGYEVELTAAAAAALAGHAGEAQLFIHHLVREDAQTLYGFATVAERDLFRTLIRMNGVGPKLGIAILGVLSPAELAQAVANADSAAISRAPGVGARTAKRLILELRDRLDDFEPIAEAPSVPGSPASEAVLALVALGYRRTEAAQAVDEVAHEGATVEVLVRDALRRMGSAA